MIERCKAFLLDNAAGWGVAPDGQWNVFFHNNYHPHHGNINLLWFRNDQPFPVLVTKVFRSPEIPTREFANLQQVHRAAPAWSPKPLHFGRQDEFWTLWMQGLPGLRFWNVSAKLLASAGDMVGEMHNAIRAVSSQSAPRRHENGVATPLRTLADFDTVQSVRDGCAMLAAKASPAWLAALPVIPQHGDLFLDNLLSHGGNWYPIDWETFGAIDLPFYDLLTLLISRLLVSGGNPDAWDSRVMKQIPAIVEGYARRLQVPAASVRILLPLTLANWFHLQWADGRQKFAARMHNLTRHYFEHTDVWERVFVPAESRRT